MGEQRNVICGPQLARGMHDAVAKDSYTPSNAEVAEVLRNRLALRTHLHYLFLQGGFKAKSLMSSCRTPAARRHLEIQASVYHVPQNLKAIVRLWPWWKGLSKACLVAAAAHWLSVVLVIRSSQNSIAETPPRAQSVGGRLC